jgi:nucleoside-diphosphate-sugar epimerase
MAYQASKKFAEKAAWDYVEDEKPGFDLVTLAPPMVYGPLRHSINGVGELSESNARIYNLFVNSEKDAPLPPNGMHVCTDVREIAEAHVRSITVHEAAGKRFIICAGRVGSQEISDLLRREISKSKERTPHGVPGGNQLDENAYECSAELAERVLGMKNWGQGEDIRGIG